MIKSAIRWLVLAISVLTTYGYIIGAYHQTASAEVYKGVTQAMAGAALACMIYGWAIFSKK